MKNKSIVMKILIIGSFVLFLLLLVVIFSFVQMLVPKKEKKETKKIITNNYSLTDINNISFDFKKSNSIFKVSEDENLVIVQNSKEDRFYLNYKQKGKQIHFTEDSYIINPQKKKYTIYIPKSYLGKITIVNGFGKIDIEEIDNDIDINNNSGEIVLEEVKNTKIKDVSGNISIKNVLGDIKVSSSTGDIIIDNIEGSINAETITGNIEVTKFMVAGDSSFENVSGDIIIRVKEKAICKINAVNETGKTKISNKTCDSEINILNIKNVTGAISVY